MQYVKSERSPLKTAITAGFYTYLESLLPLLVIIKVKVGGQVANTTFAQQIYTFSLIRSVSTESMSFTVWQMLLCDLSVIHIVNINIYYMYPAVVVLCWSNCFFCIVISVISMVSSLHYHVVPYFVHKMARLRLENMNLSRSRGKAVCGQNSDLHCPNLQQRGTLVFASATVRISRQFLHYL